MRFDFRKIVSVLASAVMLGSSAGTALAATVYPSPFVVGGAASASVVVTSGAHTGAVIDEAAALDLALALQKLVTTTSTTTTTTSGGDSVKMEKATNKLNLNNHLKDVWSTKITDADMPSLLADKTYRSKDNIDYQYEQYIDFEAATVSDVNFTHFDDNDYKKDTPTLGIRIASNVKVMNYTIDFKKYPRSDVSSAGRLEDLEDRDITILGKTYKLLNAYNKSSDTKFELMRGAVTDTINLNEEKTETVDEKKYTITLTFIDSDETQFKIVDSAGTEQTTTKLTKGGTYKLADSTQLGVTDISYQNFAGGVMSAEFTLGADKLTIENGQVLEVNDVDKNDITIAITRSEADANKVDIQKIILQWISDDEVFITPDKEAVFPAWKSLKVTSGGVTKSCEETIKIKNQGTYGIEMTVPIKDGDARLNILYGNATDFKHVAGDSDGTNNLRTGNDSGGDFLSFDRDNDDYFVASWNSSTEAESYLLDVTSITEDTSVGENYTTIQNKITGTSYTNKKTSDVITIGNVELTILKIDKLEKIADLTINTGGTFNRIYTKGGLGIWLPVNSSVEVASPGDSADWSIVFNDTDSRNNNASDDGTNAYQGAISWMLMMTEEDKDGNLGSGAVINVTLAHTSGEAEITEVAGDTAAKLYSAGAYKEIGTTNEYEGYFASDLGTKVLYRKPTSGTKSADIVYHCSQLYANVFVTAEEAAVQEATTAAAGGTVLVVKDTEVDSVKDNNLVVVGGSCINTAARKIIDPEATTPICGEDFTTKTKVGAGQYLVKAVASPYNAAKTAVLVAGYEAAETKLAVAKLKEGHATDVGTENIYPVTTA